MKKQFKTTLFIKIKTTHKIVLPILLCSLLAVPAFAKPVANHTKTSTTHREPTPAATGFDEEPPEEKVFGRFSQTMLKELKPDIEKARITLQSGNKNNPEYLDALHILGYEAVLLQNENLAASLYQQAAMLRFSRPANNMQLDDYFFYKKMMWALRSQKELDDAVQTLKAYAAYAKESKNYYLMDDARREFMYFIPQKFKSNQFAFSVFYSAIQQAESGKEAQAVLTLSTKPTCIPNPNYVDIDTPYVPINITDFNSLLKEHENMLAISKAISENKDKKCIVDHDIYDEIKDFQTTYPDAIDYIMYIKSYEHDGFEKGNLYEQMGSLTDAERKTLYKKTKALFKNQELFKTLYLPE